MTRRMLCFTFLSSISCEIELECESRKIGLHVLYVATKENDNAMKERTACI